MADYSSTMERLKNLKASYSAAYTEAEYRISKELSPLASAIAKLEHEASESVTTAHEAWSDFTRFHGIAYGHEKWLAFQKWVQLSPIMTERQARKALRYLDNKYYHFFGWKDYDEDDCPNPILKSPYAEEVASMYAMIWDRLDRWYCKQIETVWKRREKSIRPGGLFRQDGAGDLHYYSIAEHWFLRDNCDRVDLVPKSVQLASDYLDALKALLEPAPS